MWGTTSVASLELVGARQISRRMLRALNPKGTEPDASEVLWRCSQVPPSRDALGTVASELVWRQSCMYYGLNNYQYYLGGSAL